MILPQSWRSYGLSRKRQILGWLLSKPKTRRVSAATYVEAAAVIDGSQDAVASRWFDEFFREAALVVEPVTETQARVALQAYRDFGKGSGHPAQLNYGDCFTYALAHETGEQVLFKGRDFTYTDLTSAMKLDG